LNFHKIAGAHFRVWVESFCCKRKDKKKWWVSFFQKANK